MKSVIDYLKKQNPLMLAGAVILVGGAAYYLARKTVKEVAEAGAGVVTGNNVVTENQTNVDGDKVTAYEGRGVLGTLGAAANSASGGVLASTGQWIGGKLYDWFGPKIDPTK